MCTPTPRTLKRLDPKIKIRFYTMFGDLVRGLPKIDDVQAPSHS